MCFKSLLYICLKSNPMGSISKSFFALTLLFVAALVFLGFLLPRENAISVSKTISAPPDKIFAMIHNLKNWEQWSPWYSSDPDMQLTYSEPSEGKDAWYSWKGNWKVGFGKLTITGSEPNVKIETLLNYENNPPAKGSFLLEPTLNGTKVTWTIETERTENTLVDKILGGFSYISMKYFITKDFEKGLHNLENTCK